ncbi:uncharacterized protein C19orf18 homolog [Dasypus novemcinctus]|uniref:uncharacterized protein C19orf18 homolog n=1 Tax=Dasypus novemcinctus TaxID=9361 RepID=UPI00265DD6AA|nr:uncharacterized protein C19orf18 homolog isoform X1 [Dasypus novemcinctus]
MRDKFQSSLTFLFLFLMECPLHFCLPYTDKRPYALSRTITRQPKVSSRGAQPALRNVFIFTVRTSTSKQFVSPDDKKDNKQEPIKNSHSFALLQPNAWEKALTRRRPALSQVMVVGCVASSIALICGIAIACVIYRLVQAEEKEQLATLYKNVEIPIIGDEDEDEGQDESANLLPENEKELGKFIQSVIKSKRRKMKKLREEQTLGKVKKMQKAMYNSKMENL